MQIKNVYIIGGTMGAGKTTVCNLLKKKMPNCAFLDGDWCWDSEPFQVTEETKEMVLDNITYVLNNFIHCDAYETILFCWVLHEQSLIDTILERLDTAHCNVKCISLMVSEPILRNRIIKDIINGVRTDDVMKRSVARLPMYQKLKTIKIDTDDKNAEEVADMICKL